jgi:hypothetical protein
MSLHPVRHPNGYTRPQEGTGDGKVQIDRRCFGCRSSTVLIISR